MLLQPIPSEQTLAVQLNSNLVYLRILIEGTAEASQMVQHAETLQSNYKKSILFYFFLCMSAFFFCFCESYRRPLPKNTMWMEQEEDGGKGEGSFQNDGEGG